MASGREELIAEQRAELLAALKDLLHMCEAIGVFKNGVEHNGIDEGETIASGYMDSARAAIAKVTRTRSP